MKNKHWFKGCLYMIFTIIILLSCTSKNDSPKNHLDRNNRITHRQYFSNGKVLYAQLCANCHQLDGSGLGKLYPPLINSDYMLESVPRTIQIIKNGLFEEIKVNDVVYLQEMPANPELTNLEIAEITAYIYEKFGDTIVLVSPEEVDRILNNN